MSDTRTARIPRQAGAPASEHVEGLREERPWGRYTVLHDGSDSKVKRIEVEPGGLLSYQRHRHRAEHWFVVAGRARILVDGVPGELGPGDAVDIPAGTLHRIGNDGTEPVVFVEVQTGSYFGEDDIERVEDAYGRGS